MQTSRASQRLEKLLCKYQHACTRVVKKARKKLQLKREKQTINNWYE